jgi:hypothetical protein
MAKSASALPFTRLMVLLGVKMTTLRRDFYVYFHRDSAGNIFYIGKGTGHRAWSTDRHIVWHRYVEERLGGTFVVEIHKEGLTEPEAEVLEGDLISELGQQLVNWQNLGRAFDYDALNRYHRLRDENRKFVEETRAMEQTDLPLATERYREALKRMREYEGITLENGLVADLGGGPDWGDPGIINRLTVCLKKLGLNKELVEEAERYFADFPSARNLSVGKQVHARCEKARMRLG